MMSQITFLKQRAISIVLDLLAIPLAWYLAYWLRFNLDIIPWHEFLLASYLLPVLVVSQFSIFWFLGLYRGIWKFASLPDFVRILKAVIFGVVGFLIILFFIPIAVPRSVIAIYAWLLVSMLAGTRVIYRWFKSYYRAGFREGKKTLIVGAGQAADILLREFLRSRALGLYNVVAIVDDDPSKKGCDLHGVRVVGGLDSIPELIDKYDLELVVIAMPSAKTSTIYKIIEFCKNAKIECRTVPGLNDLVSGNVTVNNLREVSVADLLGREQVKLDWEGIAKNITGKRILVSGGGGSIGSELCRQIGSLAPSQLVIVDNSELNLYMIDRELREKFPPLQIMSYLVDITDIEALQDLFKRHTLHLVFHAAAYKHVPLLEHQVRAAVRNNVIGTYNIAKVSSESHVEAFVLISTDKAVNPANIMGATKRAAEMVCQYFNSISNTHFITVRFGNVLDSAGSVIPLFREQLERGKNLTVTHSEVTRYFMTIPEATQLILQAAAFDIAGAIFVLDMGKPIKIKELAEQMIYLSGKKFGDDIGIDYIGLRPGEKLYEELFYADEELMPTAHIKIKQAKSKTVEREQFANNIESLLQMCANHEDPERIKEFLVKLAPEYKP